MLAVRVSDHSVGFGGEGIEWGRRGEVYYISEEEVKGEYEDEEEDRG